MKNRIQPEDTMSHCVTDLDRPLCASYFAFLTNCTGVGISLLPFARMSALLCWNSYTQIYIIFSVSMQRLANTKAHTSRFISANLPCNKFKNRLVNIMPYESTRVCLQPIRGVEGSDYINASFIDGYRYVLTWTGSKYCSFILQENGLELRIMQLCIFQTIQNEMLFLTRDKCVPAGNRKPILPHRDHWRRPQRTSGECSGSTTLLLS